MWLHPHARECAAAGDKGTQKPADQQLTFTLLYSCAMSVLRQKAGPCKDVRCDLITHSQMRTYSHTHAQTHDHMHMHARIHVHVLMIVCDTRPWPLAVKIASSSSRSAVRQTISCWFGAGILPRCGGPEDAYLPTCIFLPCMMRFFITNMMFCFLHGALSYPQT